MGVAAWLIARVPMAVALFVVAGPILWWVDKAHAEVLTVSMIAIGLLELRDRPWWSIVAFGVAATQNPPMAGAMILALGFALYTQRLASTGRSGSRLPPGCCWRHFIRSTSTRGCGSGPASTKASIVIGRRFAS